MNKLLSTYIVITTIYNTCSIAYSHGDDENPSNYKNLGIGKTDSNDFRNYVLTTSTSRNNNKIISTGASSRNSRYLQDSNNDPTKVWTNERICNGTLEQLYFSDYERSKEPCTCSRTMNSTISSTSTGEGNTTTTTIPGLFTVNCDYSYCPQCINDGTTTNTSNSNELCGIVTNKNIFLEDVYNLAGTIRQIQNTTVCMHYTIGSTDKVCITTNYDYSTIDISCTISVGCQQCTSCSIVSCNDDGTSKPINGSDTNEIVKSAISYDCSNIVNSSINSTGIYDQCNYIPYTTKQSPPLITNDPLSFIRYTREQVSTSCFEPSNITISPPFPPISPVSLLNDKNCPQQSSSNNQSPPLSPNQSPVSTSSSTGTSTSTASVSPLSSEYIVFVMSLIAFYFI